MKTITEQMAYYEAYHKNAWNKATHVVGIPLIIFALFVLLSWFNVLIYGVPVTAAMVFAAGVLAYYFILDKGLAVLMLVLTVPMIYGAYRVALWPWGEGLPVFVGAFVGGWIFQLVGHIVFEHRKPAFTDNLIQLLIGPLFIAAEGLYVAGLGRSPTAR